MENQFDENEQNLRKKRQNKFDLQDMSTDAFSAETDLDWGGIRINPNEEFATEISEGLPGRLTRNESEVRAERRDENDAARGEWMGWVSLVAAIASLFAWPVILGPLSAFAGFVAYRLGNRTIGTWAMVIGAISFLAAILFGPFFD